MITQGACVLAFDLSGFLTVRICTRAASLGMRLLLDALMAQGVKREKSGEESLLLQSRERVVTVGFDACFARGLYTACCEFEVLLGLGQTPFIAPWVHF